MKVLAVIDSLDQGGAERSLVDTLAAMEPGEVHLVVFRPSEEGFEDDARAAGMTIHTVHGSLAARALRVRRLIRELVPDVVHSTLWSADVVARMAAVGTGAPLVCSLVSHTYAPDRFATEGRRRRLLARAVQAIDRATARRVDRFHAVTKSVSNHYQEHLGISPERIVVAWRGRDADALRPASAADREAARARLRLDGTVLLAIGRLDVQKQPAALVEAMPSILRTVPDARCVLVGRDGSATTAVEERVAELALADRVWRTGFRTDIATFLAAADRFVLPSSNEGIAGAVIEAMLGGVPVIASDLPGVREITDDGRLARLVPPGDVAALAAAIVTDLCDATAEQRALAARTHAERSFSIQAAAGGLQRVYEQAIADRARRR